MSNINRRIAGLLLWLACCVWTEVVYAARTWVFAPLPMEIPEVVIAGWKPILAEMERVLGAPIRIEYSRSYDEILDKFVAGRLDFVYLGPLPYVELKKRTAAAEPLVRFKEEDGAASYTCAIVAAGDSRISLSGMVARRIALTQPLSTCGYLATDGMMRRAGSALAENRYRYLDTHDAVALAVASGDFEAGGIKTAMARKYDVLGIKILVESPSMPGFAMVVNKDRVSPSERERLRNILATTDERARAAWGAPMRFGSVPASDADYESVRLLLPNRPIPQTGNF